MNNEKSTVIVIQNEFQKSVINNLSITSDVIDTEKTQSWHEFQTMYDPRVRYCKDDLLVLMEEESYNSLLTIGSLDLWKVLRLGWFTPHYHKTKINLHLKGIILDKLQRENSELVIDSFIRHRSLEKSEMIIDILAGGLGLSYHLYHDEFDNVLSRIEFNDDQISVPDVQDDEYQWIIQLFWYWGLISDSGVGIGSKYDMISDLYSILVNYLKINSYDRVEFFKYLRLQATSYETLKDYVNDIDELYQTYIIKNININQPVNLQKPLMEFCDMAGAELEQLPAMLEEHKSSIKKTAVYMLGLKSRYQRLNSFVDQDYFVYYLVKSVVKCIQHVELDGSTLIASLRNNLTADERELFFRVIKMTGIKKDLRQVKLRHINLEEQLKSFLEKTSITEKMIHEEEKKLVALDQQIKRIRQSKDDIGNELSQLNSVISDKEAEIASLRERLVIINERHNESINEIDILEKSHAESANNPKSASPSKRKNSNTKRAVDASKSDENQKDVKQDDCTAKEDSIQLASSKKKKTKISEQETEPEIFDVSTDSTV